MEEETKHIPDPNIEKSSLPDDPTMLPGAQKPSAVVIVNIVLFVAILFIGGILSIALPKKKISEDEKRVLTQMPTFSFDSLFHGKYTQKMENYYADNFPYRDHFVAFSSSMKDDFGYRNNGIMIYDLAKDKDASKNDSLLDEKADSIANAKDSVTAEAADTMTNDAEIVKNVMIYKGRAIQIFGGSKNSAANYAALINKYHKALGSKVKIYCLVIPTPIDYYLPDQYKHVSEGEKKNIALIAAGLDTGIIAVDAYSEVAAHKNEYEYYYTDHHWTGRGAYYAWRGFCKAAGFKPLELAQFQRKCIPHFLGSLYDLTRDSRVKANMDSVEYFKPPVYTKTTIYTGSLKSGSKSSLFAETARGGNSYSVFLGGDFPLVKIETTNPNGRKLLVIKDSYGNALAPYFALNYQEVDVVDYRYFNANLINFIRDKKITDMIFLHNTFVANSRYTAQRESFLMRMKEGSIFPNKPKTKDTTTKKPILPVTKDSTATPNK